MSGHKRVLTISHEEKEGAPALLDRYCADLRGALQEWLGEDGAAALGGWPMPEWHGETRALTVNHYESPRTGGPQIVSIKAVERELSRIWSVQIQMAITATGAGMLLDECHVTAPTSPPARPGILNLLDFLDGYLCLDVDGLQAGRVYTIEPQRVLALAQFIQAPATQRMLPVVLLSAPPVQGESYLVSPKELARALRGVAHVFRLNNHVHWPFGALPLRHSCFKGAVRVYWPGYSDGDGTGIHRYWQMTPENSIDRGATFASIADYVLAGSLRLEWETGPLAQAERARVEEIARASAEGIAEELVAEAGAKEAALHDRIARLTAELEELRAQYAALRWRVNTQWVVAEEPAAGAAGPRVLLSVEAYEALDAQDEGVRRVIETQLLAKMLDPQLRESQSDKVDSSGVTAFVFPRKRGADGKRVIFSLKGESVYIHHLFTNHDDYVQQLDAGLCCTQDEQFLDWQPQQDYASAHASH